MCIGVVRLLRLMPLIGMNLEMLYYVLVLLIEGWDMVVESGGFLT